MNKILMWKPFWAGLRNLAFLSLFSLVLFNTGGAADAVEKTLRLKTFYGLGRHLSPDGNYAVEFSEGNDNKYNYVAIYKITSGKGAPSPQVVLRKNIYFRSSSHLAWLPKCPHTLVFSTKLPKGKPYIALWDGGKSVRILRLGNLPPKVDPDAQYFHITDISKDGRTLIYQHYDMTTKEKEKDVDQRFKIKRRLTLPQSNRNRRPK